MAFGDNVTFTNSEYAATFAKKLNTTLVPTFGKISPFWAAAFSELPEKQNHTPFNYNGKMIRSSEGGRVRIHWQGAEVAVTAVSNPFAAASITGGTELIATEAHLTRFNVMHGIDSEKLKYIKGNSATIDSFVDSEAQRVVRSFLKKVATDFHGTGDQSQTTLGSWRRAIAADDALGTYLGIVRADAANAGLRGNVAGSGATALTVSGLNAAINKVVTQGGNPDLILANDVDYSLIQNELRGMDQIVDPEMTAKYGARYINVSGVPVCIDGYLAGINEIGIFDTSSWAVSFDPQGFSGDDLIRDVTKQQALIMPFDLNVSVVCENPRFNCKLLHS